MANLRVIAEIKPAGDFPVVDAPNVSVTGGKRLDVALSEAAAEVAKKANKSEVDTALASKANKSEVDATLAGKANKSEVDAAIENKADKSAFEAINASVSVNTSNIQELSTESTVLSARMDEFTKLEEGSTTGDAELIDGRIGSDGKTYDNIGGAIRGQVTDLKSDLSELDNRVCTVEFENGFRSTLIGTTVGSLTESGSYSCCVIPVTTGCITKITGTGSSVARLWATADKDLKVIRSSESNATLEDFELTINETEKYLVCNFKKDLNHNIILFDSIYDLLITLHNASDSDISEISKWVIPFKSIILPERTYDANTMTESGVWYCPGSRKNLVSNIPDGIVGAFDFIIQKRVDNITWQIIIDDRGNLWTRKVNYSTSVPISNWKNNIVQVIGDNTNLVMSQKAVTDLVKGMFKSSLYDKTLVVFGDSRTWYNGHTYGDKTKEELQGKTCIGYQQTITNMIGCNIISEGVSGNTSVQICDRIITYDFTNVDAVLFEGGVNDFVKQSSVTVGEIYPIGADFDTTTVYGAWQNAIEYVLTNYPKVKIYMTIPAIAWTSSGIFPYEIASIKKNIAELYNLPIVNLYKELGINEINRDTYYCDDVELTSWHLHFNDYGNAIVGEKLAKFIMNN